MGKFRIEIETSAKADFAIIMKSGDIASIKRIERIFSELAEHPKLGAGSPEPLKHSLSGYWSRRINKKDRMVYQIIEEPDFLVVIISALGHY